MAAGIAWMVVAWWPWRARGPAVAGRRDRWQPAWPGVDFAAMEWQPWESRVYGLALERPGSWGADEPPEQFTESDLADLKKAPVAGFRGPTPVVIYRYRAAKPRSWAEWRRGVEPGGPLRAEFGDTFETSGKRTVSGQPALEVDAHGATEGNLWHYRSLFFARGPLAYRVTAGADQRDWPRMEPVFERLLGSVRCEGARLTGPAGEPYNTPAAPVARSSR